MRLTAQRRRAGRRLVLVALLASAVLSCSGKGSDAPTRAATTVAADTAGATHRIGVGPFSVLAGSIAPVGRVLTGGLAVPSGSDLLGSVFPDVDGRGGFLALGLVLGDPATVFNDYLAQAGQLGMSVSDGGICFAAKGAIACARKVTDPSDGEALTVRVERGPAGLGFESHVALRYQAPGSIPLDGIPAPAATPPTDPPPVIALPATVPALSAAALNQWVAPFGPAMAVQAGSQLVGPPGPCGCATKGWSAVLRVTGSPAEVLTAYAATVTHGAVRTTSRTMGGRRVLSADLGLVAGGFVQLRTVTGNGVTYLLIAVATP